MNISRRFFLGGTLAVATAIAVPIELSARLPILHGDGVHDDWKALQAFASGKPFRTVDGFVGTVTEGTISGGDYFIGSGKMLEFEPGVKVMFEGVRFLRGDGMEPIYCDRAIHEKGKCHSGQKI